MFSAERCVRRSFADRRFSLSWIVRPELARRRQLRHGRARGVVAVRAAHYRVVSDRVSSGHQKLHVAAHLLCLVPDPDGASLPLRSRRRLR